MPRTKEEQRQYEMRRINFRGRAMCTGACVWFWNKSKTVMNFSCGLLMTREIVLTAKEDDIYLIANKHKECHQKSHPHIRDDKPYSITHQIEYRTNSITPYCPEERWPNVQ